MKPQYPFNSPFGMLYLLAAVVLCIVAYRKLAPASVQKSLPV